MKILVTGGAGFIGSHVWRQLERTHELLGIDAFEPQVHGDKPVYPDDGRINVLTVGCASTPGVAKRLWDVDAVIHLAAVVGVGQSQYEPTRYVRGNVLETVQLCERVIAHRQRIRKLVVASSMSVYGEGEYANFGDGVVRLRRQPSRGWDAFDVVWPDGIVQDVREELQPRPTRETKRPQPASVYAQTKLDTEQYAMLLGETYGIPTVALRFWNCYGQGQALANPYTGAVAQFACRVLNGQPPLVYEDGRQLRDFIHVSDVAAAVVRAVEQEDLHGIYNVCTGQGTPIVQLADDWCRIAHDDYHMPTLLPDILQTYRAGDVRHCFGDPTTFAKVSGWEATVDVRWGLRGLATWLQQGGALAMPPPDRSAAARAALQERGLERGGESMSVTNG